MPSKESIYYDKVYRENEAPFGSLPDKEISQILDYKKSGSVLDIGAGEGHNALFLAKAGFEVTAEDISRIGIEKIQKKAKENGLTINAEVKDIRTENFDKNFDTVICTFVLHNIPKPEALSLVEKIKKHTNADGLNVISTFTENGDFYRNHPHLSENFYPKEGELKELYGDWEILDYQETQTLARAKNKDGSSMFNVTAKILARKPK
jgi:tellurite methyltransferase